MVYGDKADERVKIISTDISFQNRFCLSDEMVIQLSDWIVKIEEYYTKIKNRVDTDGC